MPDVVTRNDPNLPATKLGAAVEVNASSVPVRIVKFWSAVPRPFVARSCTLCSLAPIAVVPS